MRQRATAAASRFGVGTPIERPVLQDVLRLRDQIWRRRPEAQRLCCAQPEPPGPSELAGEISSGAPAEEGWFPRELRLGGRPPASNPDENTLAAIVSAVLMFENLITLLKAKNTATRKPAYLLGEQPRGEAGNPVGAKGAAACGSMVNRREALVTAPGRWPK